MHGALLINKDEGISSFGVIDSLKRVLRDQGLVRRSDFPKLGHGGTLDPFATGLLTVCVGRGVKLARYFLGSDKSYDGVVKFGETTVPGDPTAPISERSEKIPASIEELRKLATAMTLQGYLQIPPMHSAKKKDGKPLYELARQGIEIEREPKLCQLKRFEIRSYAAPVAEISVDCTSGTYIRTLAQDYAKLLGSVGLLEKLHRTASGRFHVKNAWRLSQIVEESNKGVAWSEFPCWIPFDRLLEGFDHAEATDDEATALFQGRQGVLADIINRAERKESHSFLPIYRRTDLIAIARQENQNWELERVFLNEES